MRINTNFKKRKSNRVALALFLSTILLVNLPVITLQSKSFHGADDDKTDETYDLLIITPQKFSRYLSALVEHKIAHQVKTKKITTEDIFEQMAEQGKDSAEKIKYFIKEAVETWGITYVLFVGGRKGQGPTEKWWVPVRYTYLNRNYDAYPEGKFLTDLYFADIYNAEGNFSSWDTNDNGIFGEWPKNSSAIDIPDLYPDVYVGRLPCRNGLEVLLAVRKIIQYETEPCSDSWFKTMVVVAGDTYPNKTAYIDGEVYTQMGLDKMPGFESVKIWASKGNLHWTNIVKAINNGCGFVWFSGHGGPGTWATHPPYDKTWIGDFGLLNMRFLFNRNKLPVCISGSGCFNSMFNVSLFNSPHVYGLPLSKCWSWGLAGKPLGGSIATIASTGFSYESPDINVGVGGCEWLDIHFFGEYGLNGTDILGETWGNTITSFLQNFTIDWNDTSDNGHALIAKNVEQWLLLGDPSLKIGGYGC